MLPGPFEKHTGGGGEKTARWLEGPEHVISWAVGHLVQLAEPEEYDDKYKKWRMADLPIVPRASGSSCATSARRSRCPSCASSWAATTSTSSSTPATPGARASSSSRRVERRRGADEADQAAVALLDDERRDARGARAPARRRGHEVPGGGGQVALGGRLDRRHERDPRRDDPAAVLLRRRRIARAGPDPDAGDPRPPRGGDPRLRPRGLLARRRALRGRRRAPYAGRFHAGPQPRLGTAEEAEAIARPCAAGRRRSRSSKGQAHRARAAALRPHVAAARGEHAVRLLARGARWRRRSAATRSTRP